MNNRKTKIIAVILLLFAALVMSACVSTNQDKEERELTTAEQLEGGNNMESEMEVLLKITDRDTAEDVIEKIHEFASDTDIISAAKHSDDVGNGLQIKTENGKVFNVYMYSDGMIFGIKDVETQEYVYAVYE